MEEGRSPSRGEAPAGDEWIATADAAALVGVGGRTLREAARTGKLPARRIRQVWVVRLPEVQAWLKAARHRPGPRPGHGVGRPRAAKGTTDAGAPA